MQLERWEELCRAPCKPRGRQLLLPVPSNRTPELSIPKPRGFSSAGKGARAFPVLNSGDTTTRKGQRW